MLSISCDTVAENLKRAKTISMVQVLLLLLGISLLCSVTSCQKVDSCFCVEPTSGSVDNSTKPCQGNCNTLMYYADFMEKNITNHSTFYLLPGTHLMNNSILSLYKVDNIALVGYSNSTDDGSACGFPGSTPVATVECEGMNAGFHFHYINYLSIVGIKFNSCGYKSRRYKNQYMNAIAILLVWNLCMHSVEVHDTKGVGIYGYEIVGNSIISSTTVNSSHISNLTSGNIHIYYEYLESYRTYFLNITDTNIIDGKNIKFQPSHRPHAGGLYIYLKTTNKIHILLNNVTLSGNTGYNGGNAAVEYIAEVNTWLSTITIQNCKFLDGFARGFGAGLYTSLIAVQNKNFTGHNHSNHTQVLSVTDSIFENNKARKVGAGMYIQLHENSSFRGVAIMSFTGCQFRNNYIHSITDGRGGSAVNIINFRIPDYIPHHLPQYNISFTFCNFTENSARAITSTSVGSGAFYVEENAITILKDCQFLSNFNCTGLSAVHSNLVLQGDIEISNNAAVNGGGIVMCANSVMYLANGVDVTIKGNHATQNGGGIYAEFECSQAIPPCFFQVNSTQVHLNITVHLLNNTAHKAGNALYGGSVDHCYFFGPYNKDVIRADIFDQLFEITSLMPNDTSNVTSNPLRVCFCDELSRRNCNKSSIHREVYSGAEVQVNAVVVGQRDGTVPGVVMAELEPRPNVHHTLGHLQETQVINSTNCSDLKYTVYSDISTKTNGTGRHVNISLSIQDSDFRSYSEHQEKTVNVQLHVKPCPPGFNLTKSSDHYECQCMVQLKNMYCNISTVSIHRPGKTKWWIGIKNSSTHIERELIYSKLCPYDFCISKAVNIHTLVPFSADKQCANERRGTLCGACKRGLSNVLGSSHCKDCKTSFVMVLGLILLYAVFGIVLVLFVGVLDLSVTEGTLNAIIFYMNIVRVNTNTFFDSPEEDSSWLTVFVAWMNLDLGIEMCLYNGMGAVGKTGLQFVFPLYLWCLAGLIIYFSRKSSMVTKLVGKNTVKVLATIILHSYAKILRTIIDISNVAIVKSSDGKHYKVWAMDGNIPYCNRPKYHAALFSFAVIVAVITLPYTLALLFIQCLRKRSNMKVLFWVNKLKPFFDAYTGPYKDNYHFWTGLLLIVRIALFVGIVLNTSRGPTFNLTLVGITASLLFLLIQPGIYKKRTLNIIEAFTYFNLIVFAALTTYDVHFNISNKAPIIMCVGSMFLLFCGVVVYHVYKKLSDTQRWRKVKVWLLERRWPWMKQKPIRSLILHINPDIGDELSSSDSELDPILHNAPPVARYDEYREPLIETGENM